MQKSNEEERKRANAINKQALYYYNETWLQSNGYQSHDPPHCETIQSSRVKSSQAKPINKYFKR